MTARARLLTPAGPAAIAVVEVAGSGAAAALARVFRRRGGRRALPGPGEAAVGLVDAPDGALADEVLLLRPGEEERFEVDGHGGPGVTVRLLGALAAAGVATAPPLAPPLLARARTWLGVRVASWVDEGLLAPDDPLVAPLLEPRRVVLAGRPNAGKSALMNALLERARAIVSEEEGTTRDVLEEETALEGVPLVLCDAAGVSGVGEGGAGSGVQVQVQGEGEGEKGQVQEKAQVQGGGGSREPGTEEEIARAAERRALEAARGADLVLRCVEGSRPLEGEEAAGLLAAAADPRAILVLTKADLPAAFEAPAGALRVSSRTGAGIAALARAVAARLLGRDPATVRRPAP